MYSSGVIRSTQGVKHSTETFLLMYSSNDFLELKIINASEMGDNTLLCCRRFELAKEITMLTESRKHFYTIF